MADALAGETKTSLDVFEFNVGMHKPHKCHSERQRRISHFLPLTKTRSFGGVYPENIEGPQDDIATQALRGEALKF